MTVRLWDLDEGTLVRDRYGDVGEVRDGHLLFPETSPQTFERAEKKYSPFTVVTQPAERAPTAGERIAAKWAAGMRERYRAARALGLHGDECEQRENFYLCNCSKRAREARGLTNAPEISFRSPLCDGCDEQVYHDGDAWRCETCATTWSSDAGDGDQGEFYDDHGVLDPPDGPPLA